jgi:hypothetical protein
MKNLCRPSQILVVVLSLLICSVYFISLDQDVLPYSIISINQEDEAYYSASAIEEYNQLHNRETDFDTPNSSWVMYSYPFTTLTLNTFGNNFYGLRVPVVLIGLLSIFIMFISIRKVTKSNLSTGLIILIFSFLALDFTFFNYARYSNPQVYSVLGNAILLLVLIWKQDIDKVQSFTLGFLAVFIVLFIYPYNVFLSLAVGLYLLIYSIKKRHWSLPLWGVLGAVVSVGLFSIWLMFFGESLQSFIDALSAHGGGVEAESTFSFIGLLKSFIYSATGILSTHLFRYNPLLLISFICAFILSIRVLLINKLKETLSPRKSRVIYFSLIALCLAVLQGTFVHSYPFKKWISLLPVIILLIAVVGQLAIVKSKSFKKFKLWLSVSTIIGLLAYLFVFRNLNTPEFWNHTWNFTTLPVWAKIFSIGLASVLTLLFFFYIFTRNFRVLLSGLFLQVFFSVALVAHFNFKNASYEIRNALIDMEDKTKGKLGVNGFTHFYQFYSGLIPAYHHYRKREDPQFYAALADSIHRGEEECFDIYKIVPGYEFNPMEVRHLESATDVRPGDSVDIYGYSMKVVDVYPFEEYFYLLLSNKDNADN